MTGYLNNHQDTHEKDLDIKRKEYSRMRDQYYTNYDIESDPENREHLSVIKKDVSRTFQETQIFKNPVVKSMLTRLLFVWNMRYRYLKD